MDFTLKNIKGFYFTTTDTSIDLIEKGVQTIAKNYISNGFSTFDDAIKAFQSQNPKTYHFYGVFRVSEADKEEQWIYINIPKQNDMKSVSTVKMEECDGSTSELIKKELTSRFNDNNFYVSKHSDMVCNVLNNGLEAIYELPKPFDRAVVAELCNVFIEDQIQRVLSSLESLLTTIPKYTLERQQFIHLCELTNSRKLQPSKGNLISLKIKIMKVIVQLKENGQIIDKNIITKVFESESGFLVKENSVFLQQIEKYDKILRENPRNVKIKKLLQYAIDYRIEYLTTKNKLVPDLVTLEEVFQMFEHFVLEKEIKNLKSDVNSLEEECVKKTSEAGQKDDSSFETAQEELIKASIDTATSLKQKHHELEYLTAKFSIRSDCNFKNLIPVVASQALESQVPSILLSKILDVEFSESLVKDIITIIFASPKIDENQHFPDQIYKHLTPEQLVNLTERLSVCSSTLIDRLVTIMIENENDQLRKRAFNALTKVTRELPDEIKAIINLETKIQSAYKYINANTRDILDHVMKNYRLTRNCFNQFTNIGEGELNILKTVIDKDLQSIPKFLIAKIIEKLKSNFVLVKKDCFKKFKNWSSTIDMINLTLQMCELMIIENYMSMSEVSKFLVDHLKDENYREIVLTLILTVSLSGETIPKSIKKEIEMIKPQTVLEYNCIRAVTKEETFFDILKNSKKSIVDRKSALNQLVNNRACHNDYLVQILVDLVIFEPKLRDDAFKAFLIVITAKMWEKCCNQFSEMVEVLKVPESRISIKAINDASKKDFLQHNDALIDYLLCRLTEDDFTVENECVAALTDLLKISQNKVWIEILLNIVYFKRHTEIKLSILSLITNGFNLEAFDTSIKIKVDKLKTLLCQKINETHLPFLIEIIEQGFIVSESIINGVITCFQQNKFLTCQCLLMIHAKQGLMSLHSSFLTIENPEDSISLNNQNRRLNVKMIQKLLDLLNDEHVYVNQFALIMLNDYLIPFIHDPEIAQIKQELIKILRQHCRKMSNKEFAKQALRTLISIDDTISTNHIFIRHYYKKLQRFLAFLNNKSRTNIVKFISNKKNRNRIQVLYALTITVTNKLLVPEICVATSKDEWLKDLLYKIFIQSIIIEMGEVDELALFDFLTDITKLEVWLNQNNQRLEQILQCLINSNIYNLKVLSEVIYLLKDKDTLKVFLRNTNDISQRIYEMKEIFLQKRLPSFSPQQIEKLLKCTVHYSVRTIENLIDIEYDLPESLIQFFERVQFYLSQHRQESFLNNISNVKSLQYWNALLSNEILQRLVEEKQFILNDDALNSFKMKLARVLDSGWSIRSIEIILDRCNGLKDVQIFLSALDIIYEYRLKEYDSNKNGRSLIEIVTTDDATRWNESFNQIAIYQTFPGTFNKPIEQLFDEICNLNSEHDIGYLKERDKILEDYAKVKNAYHNKSLILTESSSIISKFDKKLIKKWSKKCKDHEPSVHESIAVTMRAVEILNKFLPREIQILSLLCLLNPETNKGRLAQINTGEGKTTIIAMLAVIKALQGHTVDIITSSGELAKPQSIEMEPFYSMFDLIVAHNGEDSKDIKERYKANILYGAADAFQGDSLRDEYSKEGTRNGRKCDLAIVDEVDSMLIDGKNHIVMLSSFMPAMNFLEPILAAIYIHIGIVAKLIVERDGKAFVVQRKNSIDDENSTMKDVEVEEVEIKVSKREFIEQCTELHIRRILRDTEGLKAFTEDDQKVPKDYTELSIPKHLYKLVTGTQLKKWIDSAIYAMFKCELNKDYVLTEDGNIAPVDATNTGVIQQNMHWNNGLHQFLQIKHGAKITPENLTTNFISNVSFFKRYKKNLFGLTGTLGSDDSIKLLNKTYSVDSLIIPPFKQKQHFELTPIIVANEQEWYANIIESTLQKLHQGQGVLIIAKYINQVNFIHESLKSKYDPKKIKVYKTQSESDSVHAELKVGEVIIATNIAGRGTDIKPSPKIDENGGLHVCLTFLPENARVEAQNVGRTSRTGNKGTSQFILLEKSNQSLDHLRRIRNKNETNSLEKAEKEITGVCTKDAIFREFCDFLNKFNMTEIKPLEEKFGIWLQTYGEKLESEKDGLTLFKETFEDEVMKDSNQIRNICFHVLKANKFIKIKKFDEAIVECDKAIKMDPDFADAAYYFQGYCRIAKYGGDLWWTHGSKNDEMILHATDDFKKARAIIKRRLLELNIIQQANHGPNLSEQVKNKTIVYQVQLRTIEQAIGIDLTEAEEDLKSLKLEEEKIKKLIDSEENLKKSELEEKKININKEETEKLKQSLIDIQNRVQQINEEIAEDEGGVIGKALRNNRDIRIVLMELEQTLPPDQDVQYFKQEIGEFKRNGVIGHFNISELEPIPRGQVFAMALIGLVQIAVGALILTGSLGSGTPIGAFLIIEGISDLFTAIKDGIINRDIDWIEWGMMKVVSYAVSLYFYGGQSIKDAAKTLVAAANVGFKTVGQGITKQGMKIAFKHVAVEFLKGFVRETVTSLVEYGLEHIALQKIEDYLVTNIRANITKALENNEQVKTLLEIDLKKRDCNFQSQIRQAAYEILNPQHQKKFIDYILKIAYLFTNRIANAKLKGIGTATQVVTAGLACVELITFVEKFMEKLTASIKKITKQIEKAHKNDNDSRIDQEQSKINQGILSSSVSDVGGEIDLEKANDVPEHATVQEGHVSFDQICQAVSEDIAQKMTNIIKSKIVMPVTHAAVNFTIDKSTSEIEGKLANELELYKSIRVTLASEDRLPDEIKERLNDPIFETHANAQAVELIQKVQQGGEISLIELRLLSDMLGLKIDILNEDGYYTTFNPHLPGEAVKVQFSSLEGNGGSGHWGLPSGKACSVRTGGFNCLFDAIAHQTGRDPYELRFSLVEYMMQRSYELARTISEYNFVKEHGKKYLMYGGKSIEITPVEIIEKANKRTRKYKEKLEETSIIKIEFIYDDKTKLLLMKIVHGEFGPDTKGITGTVSKSKEAKEELRQRGGSIGYDMGHNIAKSKGGSNGLDNIDAMKPELNQNGGSYRHAENQIACDIKKNNVFYKSQFKTEYEHVNGNIVTPKRFVMDHLISSEKGGKPFRGRTNVIDVSTNTCTTTTFDLTADGQKINKVIKTFKSERKKKAERQTTPRQNKCYKPGKRQKK